ncbi:Uncharacterized protein PBTT_05987 [Plasmodiophora brassicae]
MRMAVFATALLSCIALVGAYSGSGSPPTPKARSPRLLDARISLPAPTLVLRDVSITPGPPSFAGHGPILESAPRNASSGCYYSTPLAHLRCDVRNLDRVVDVHRPSSVRGPPSHTLTGAHPAASPYTIRRFVIKPRAARPQGTTRDTMNTTAQAATRVQDVSTANATRRSRAFPRLPVSPVSVILTGIIAMNLHELYGRRAPASGAAVRFAQRFPSLRASAKSTLAGFGLATTAIMVARSIRRRQRRYAPEPLPTYAEMRQAPTDIQTRRSWLPVVIGVGLAIVLLSSFYMLYSVRSAYSRKVPLRIVSCKLTRPDTP